VPKTLSSFPTASVKKDELRYDRLEWLIDMNDQMLRSMPRDSFLLINPPFDAVSEVIIPRGVPFFLLLLIASLLAQAMVK
jgi:hypothetical protein